MKRFLILLIPLLAIAIGCSPIHDNPLLSREPVILDIDSLKTTSAPYEIGLAEVFIDKLYPGAYVDTFTTTDKIHNMFKAGDPTGVIIVNNMNCPRHYEIRIIQPNQLKEGFSKAPGYVLAEWVRVSNPNPILAAKEARLIPISLWMPPDAEIFADKWEFRVRVKDIDQTGMLQTAYEARWFVEMQ